MDLYKRDGKYDQTRCFVIRKSCQYPLSLGFSKIDYQIPIIALISSIQSNLLNHNDVVNLFHEFGHIMHNIFGKTKYSLFSGISVENDFVETPAQVLEYLCWDKNILKKLSCHFKSKQSLPDDIIDKMVKMRDLDIGIHYKKHCLIGIYDQLIHSSDVFIKICRDLIDPNTEKMKSNLIPIFSKIYKKLHQQILCSYTNNNLFRIGYNDGILFPGPWLNYLFLNNNLYYSKIWSKVYAADIYNMYKSDVTPLKDKILKFGGSKKSIDMMTDILGRQPNIDGFIKLHNLGQDEEFSYYFSTEHFEKNIVATVPLVPQVSQITKTPVIPEEYTDNLSDESITDTASYSNRFSEIYIDNNNYNKYFKNKIKNIENDDNYANMEYNDKYDNIFIKN